MKKIFAQADLSGWLSPDEERLLNLYRDFGERERDHWLYRLTRRKLVHMVPESFDTKDLRGAIYIEEELEQWLGEICPAEHLGDFYCDDCDRCELIGRAWGPAAPVVLGTSEHDGQRADELFNTAVQLWDSIGNPPGKRPPLNFSRSDALKFLEAWREAALKHAFTKEPEANL